MMNTVNSTADIRCYFYHGTALTILFYELQKKASVANVVDRLNLESIALHAVFGSGSDLARFLL